MSLALFGLEKRRPRYGVHPQEEVKGQVLISSLSQLPTGLQKMP